MALRPENIRMTPREDKADTDTIDGHVHNTAYLGDRTHLYVRVRESDHPVLVARQNLDGTGSSRADGVSPVKLWWRRSSVLLLASD